MMPIIESLLLENLLLGKNLTSNAKITMKNNYKPKVNKEARKTKLFFSKPGRVYNKMKIKYQRAVHHMSLKTFQTAQQIIPSFN